MLDASKVRKIVRKHTKRLSHALWLNDWTIRVDVDALNGSPAAECTPDPRYRTATITIDPAKHDSETEVLRSLRHELLHIVTAEYQCYRLAVGRAVTSNDHDLLDAPWEVAEEKTIALLERILDDLDDGTSQLSLPKVNTSPC